MTATDPTTRTAATAPEEASERPATEPAAAPPGERFRGYPVVELVDDFRLACVSRAIDDRQIAMQKQSRVFFQISGAGHEALGLALARHLRPGYDWFFPYYREQALVLGLGVTPTEVLLQAVGSADDPSSAGRQMPAHWGHRARNIVTQSSPTGSQCVPAVGCAEAGRYLVRRPHLTVEHGASDAHGDELTYVSLGEGACSEGEFWESLNTAANLHLPVLYVVPDNGFAISVPVSDQHPAPIHELVQGFRGLEVHHLDGTDYFGVRDAAKSIVEHVRAGVGPALVHADVVRPYSHSAADTQSKYRSVEELAEEARHDPIDRFEHDLVAGGVLTADEAAAIRAEAKALVVAAATEALAGARPDPATVTAQVTALPALPVPPTPGVDGAPAHGGEPVPLGEAIKRTLHEQMAADERIRVFGEDVADAREQVLAGVEGKGGVFGTTHGLQRAFGQARCFNTPLSEANIVGRAVGQALRGLRPAPEVQFFDYVWPAMTQIRSEAATIRWRSNGSFTCPMVLRIPIGGYLTGGSIWHSQCGESIFAHIPGLAIAMPSRARDAAGLLRYAFRCEDPVLFLEHKHLLRQPYTADPFPDAGWVVPFGVGEIRRPGDDATVVSWGATVEKSLQAAEALAEREGIEAEVIDLRTIAPWDHAIVAASVARTGRLLVVHEDTLTAGFGGEVAAWAGEHCFADLDAPVRRIGATDTPVAYEPTLEQAILPQVDGIAAALLDLATW
ncbi:MAG TPA: dehydrogenase E1 component subunit alpha/beta [Aquihabitans sp.]|jgi:2-oxoisovalerate dehydrogenase E1 component|nr:dehydrogenase E1 component subunit alpha/beta [Aquihabitans sp.]